MPLTLRKPLVPLGGNSSSTKVSSRSLNSPSMTMCSNGLLSTKFRPLRGDEIRGGEISSEKFVEVQTPPTNYHIIDCGAITRGALEPLGSSSIEDIFPPSPIWQRVTNRPDYCPTIVVPPPGLNFNTVGVESH